MMRYFDLLNCPQQSHICRQDCEDCDHSNPEARSVLPPTHWTETIVRDNEFINFIIGPLRGTVSPKFGLWPLNHTGDGMLNVFSLKHVSKMKLLLHTLDWRKDDFFVSDSSPYSLFSDELLVDCSPDDVKPLYVTMEEATFDVGGTLHLKVI